MATLQPRAAQRTVQPPICHPKYSSRNRESLITKRFSTYLFPLSLSPNEHVHRHLTTFDPVNPIDHRLGGCSLIMSARSLVSSTLFRAVSARSATSSSFRVATAAPVGVRTFSHSVARSSARPTIQGDGKGDRVNSVSPFIELAGSNPVDKYTDIAGPLHDFGSYITSCMSQQRRTECDACFYVVDGY